MERQSHYLSRRTLVGGATAIGIASLVTPSRAFAEPASDAKRAEAEAVRLRVHDLQGQLNKASDSYYGALYAHDDAVKAVEDAQTRIDEATVKIGDLQGQLSTRVNSMYKTGDVSFLDMLLGSSTFEEFVTNWEFLTKMNQRDADMVAEVKGLREDVEQQKSLASAQEKVAAEKAAEAKRIADAAAGTVAEMQSIYNSLDAEAIALLAEEDAAAREALWAQQQVNPGGSATTPGTGTDSTPTPSPSPTPDPDPTPTPTPDPDPSPAPSGGTSYPEIADLALSKKGCPYEWGADGPNAFDCSGLVTWAFRQIGIWVPHQTEAQFKYAKWIGPVWQARKGDVLWVGYGDGYNGHVGIACCDGGSWYVHAPTFYDHVRDDYPLSWAGFTHALRF